MSNTEISIFDVKQLYDAAYDELNRVRDGISQFDLLIARAEKLDAQYRSQLVDAPTFSYGRATA